MKNSVFDKILNQKIGLKSENRYRKIESCKKIVVQRISVKNFCREMRKIGLGGKKILGQKIGVKNSCWKMYEKIGLSR